MGTRETELELAARGTESARRRARAVTRRLAERRIGAEFVAVEIDGSARGLDGRVLAGEFDGAIHAAETVPVGRSDGSVIAAVPERGPAADVLVTPGGTALDGLPSGATVGAAGPLRGAQLRARRADLDVVGLRGTVGERLERLLAPTLRREHRRRLEAAGELEDPDGENNRTPEGWFDSLTELERRALGREVDTEYDAICLAAAELERSGLDRGLETERLDPRSFVPAPGQGAIAVTAADGEIGDRIHDAIDHPPSRVRVTVERAVLDGLGGDHAAPIGVYAHLQGAVVTATARVLSRDGTEAVGETRGLPVERHAEAAAAFGADLAADGAAALVERARHAGPGDRGG